MSKTKLGDKAETAARRERIAAIQHEIWAHWMFHLITLSDFNSDGSLTIPVEKMARWRRQMAIPYSQLSESEQTSGLRQADKVLEVL